MKIESLTKAGKGTDRFTVRFEDAGEINVSAAQIADFSLYTGRELSTDEYGALREAAAQNASKARALRILGSRNISARELERRLASKGDSAETAKKTAEWLEETGLINDAEYAASIVTYYTDKGYGTARIRDELFRRGIPREISDEVIGDISPNDEATFKYLEKRLRGSRDKADLRNAASALYRRGFSYEEARAAVNKYLEHIDSDEHIDQ